MSDIECPSCGAEPPEVKMKQGYFGWRTMCYNEMIPFDEVQFIPEQCFQKDPEWVGKFP